MKNFKTAGRRNSLDTSDNSSDGSLPFGSDVDGPVQGHAPVWGERVMRMTSDVVAPSAVAILAVALLCGSGGPAMSQTTPSSTLPGITVVAPKEVSRPHRPVQEATRRR